MRSRPAHVLHAALLCAVLGCWAPVAQADRFPLHMRVTLGGAAMLSKDQLGRLGFDSGGAVGDLQLGYALLHWLSLRAGVGGGGFPSEEKTGGVLGPLLGAALIWPEDVLIRPWLQLDVGAAFTGPLLRPLFRAGIGADFRISNVFTIAPVLGYAQVFQDDRRGSSTDARYVWFGLVLGIEPIAPRSEPVRVRVREVVKARTVVREEVVPRPPPAEPPINLSEPSPELVELIDSALPGTKNEWLAPVLFAFDSAELEPQGVAMLHEVARELARRPQLKLLEIHGYADSRGSQAHNLALSARRATAVLEWLVEHGVARARLRVAPEGARDFVESGSAEAQQQQNRRVVFRVVDPAP